MYLETANQLYYYLIDFGSSCLHEKMEERIETFSLYFSPPEQNTENESFHSDVYSLGVSIFNILKNNKIELSETVIRILERMVEKDFDKRPTIFECYDTIFSFTRDFLFSPQNCKTSFDFLCFVKSLKAPVLCKNFDLLKKQTHNLQRSDQLIIPSPQHTKTLRILSTDLDLIPTRNLWLIFVPFNSFLITKRKMQNIFLTKAKMKFWKKKVILPSQNTKKKSKKRILSSN